MAHYNIVLLAYLLIQNINPMRLVLGALHAYKAPKTDFSLTGLMFCTTFNVPVIWTANGKLSGMHTRIWCNVAAFNPHHHHHRHRSAVSKNLPTPTELQNPSTHRNNTTSEQETTAGNIIHQSIVLLYSRRC